MKEEKANVFIGWKTPVSEEEKQKSLDNVSAIFYDIADYFGQVPGRVLIEVDGEWVNIRPYPYTGAITHRYPSAARYHMNLADTGNSGKGDIADEMVGYAAGSLLDVEYPTVFGWAEGISMDRAVRYINPSDNFLFTKQSRVGPFYEKMVDNFNKGEQFFSSENDSPEFRGSLAIAALINEAHFNEDDIRNLNKRFITASQNGQLTDDILIAIAETMAQQSLPIFRYALLGQ